MTNYFRLLKKLILTLFLSGLICVFSSCINIELRDGSVKKVETDVIFFSPINILKNDKGMDAICPIDFEENIMNVEHGMSSDSQEWIKNYDIKHGAGESDKIILTEEMIKEYNRKITQECPALFDMTSSVETMKGDDVRHMILSYSMPYTNKYSRDGVLISSSVKDEILKNRNIDGIEDEVVIKYGVIVNRCDLRSFPTELGFYDAGDKFYSSIQETELITGFPVFILHESSDGEFLFVQSYYYAGWINKSAVAFADFEKYTSYVSPEKFIVITEPEIIIDDIVLNMGCVLPYVCEDDSYFYALIPSADNNGNLIEIEQKTSKSKSSYGFLPFNMRNYYRQVFTYLGVPYGWGGADGGVDCSGFVCAVFRAFGIYLPRNTGEQSQYNGAVIQFSGLNSVQIAQLLSEIDVPASIHRKGHVMLYLGEKDGQYYVIHAPRGGELVSVMPLALPGNLTGACVIQ